MANGVLEQALAGGASRVAYAAEAGISMPTATGDLRARTDAGFLARKGAGRSTSYLQTEEVRAILEEQLRYRWPSTGPTGR